MSDKTLMSDEEYPKMVYPAGHSVDAAHAGAGKLVHSAEEEAEAMKDSPKAEEKADWTKTKTTDKLTTKS